MASLRSPLDLQRCAGSGLAHVGAEGRVANGGLAPGAEWIQAGTGSVIAIVAAGCVPCAGVLLLVRAAGRCAIGWGAGRAG